jgi:uncharacterized iron-regulated membrane protein
MTFRKTVFWLHLAAGVVAASVILVMSVTGVLLTYEKQIIAWTDRGFRVNAPSGATRLPVEELLEKIHLARGAWPTSVTLKAGANEPAAFAYGRDTVVYVDPYTGAVSGEGSKRIRALFQSVTAWHRWLAQEGNGRAAGRAITGASNLVFLVLVLSGAYLWLPRVWTRTAVRAVALFRGGLTGKARDFNWHNVAGVWCLLPLLLIVVSGVVMSYPWANALVFKLAGTAPPAPREGGPRREGDRPRPVETAGLNELWMKAQGQTPDWRSVTFQLGGLSGPRSAFVIDSGDGTRPQTRGTLTLDRRTGQTIRWEPFGSGDAGRRWRTWLRFVHTGEYYGLAGQTVAGVASAGGALLVWTGVSLSLRRLARWRRRRAGAREDAAPRATAAA